MDGSSSLAETVKSPAYAAFSHLLTPPEFYHTPSQERDGVDVHRPATRERHLRQEVRGVLATDYDLPAPATAEPGHEGRRRAQHAQIGQAAAVPLLSQGAHHRRRLLPGVAFARVGERKARQPTCSRSWNVRSPAR